MRSRTRSSARSPEEVGRRIAGEMRGVFTDAVGQDAARDRIRRRVLEAVTSVRAALYEAVNGFNGQAPWDYHLALLNRGDRMIFNSLGRFTLTVTFEEDRVLIHPATENVEHAPPMRIDMVRLKDGYHFQATPGTALPASWRKQRGLDERGLAERGVAERGLDERGLDERGLDERGLDERDAEDRPVWTQLQFVDSVIRMACHPQIGGPARC